MDEKALKRKSIISTASLFFQSGYSAILGFAANIILTIYLSPEVFGIYITVLSIIILLNYFSDIGLAASLIQRKEITDDDLKTAFTVQQMLIISIVSLGLLLTRPIMDFYKLGIDGQHLYWALLFAFFISSLKTIPSVLLERNIRFHKIVVVQVVENTTFYTAVIVCAIMGFGVLSFAIGVLLRSIVGLVVIYRLSFWMPGIRITRKSLKHLLSYGVPFQSMSFLAIFKDELVNLYLGKVIGFEALGFIGWAKKWAESPLRIIMDNISKVVFPLFARVQSDPKKQKNVIEKVLKYQSMLLIPASLGMLVVLPMLIDILPKYEKWRPALPFFYIFVASSLLFSYSTPFINFFSAIGKIGLSLKFMIGWTVMMWVLVVPLSIFYGIYGFPITVLSLALTFVIVVLKARTFVKFDFLPSIMKYIISGVVMSAVCFVVRSQVSGYWGFALTILVGGVVYYATLLVIFRDNLLDEVRGIMSIAKG